MKEETKVVLGIIVFCLVIFAGIAYFGSKSDSNQLAETETVSDQSRLVRENSWKIEAPDSKVTLVEFADMECESCRAVHPIVKKILTDYEGKITFVLRNFPLHNNSVLAAKVVEAAGEQGKFWEMHNKLFERQPEWGEKREPQTELFIKYAQELGLDLTAFDSVISSTKYEDKIARDQEDGKAVGVRGTPTFYLNGKQIPGVPSYAQLKQLIDIELNK